MTTSSTCYTYDGSFDGFLSVVFETARRYEIPAYVETDDAPPQGGLFGETVAVATDAERARRVEHGLERRVRQSGVEKLYYAFLSEVPGIEHLLVRLIARVLDEGPAILEDLRFPPALAAERLAMRVRHEVHRMHAFVRFERRAGEHFVAVARPEHNVLPLLEDHFAARYPAMRWAIVDARRHYALVHTPVAERAPGEPATHFAPADDFDALPEASDEPDYQNMWQTYYTAVTIPERRNLKLHLRHVPRRYWPYLTEKRPVLPAGPTIGPSSELPSELQEVSS